MKVSGEKIKTLRGAKSIEGLAKAADLTVRRIQQIEHEERSKVNLNVGKAIARFLGVPLDKIAVVPLAEKTEGGEVA